MTIIGYIEVVGMMNSLQGLSLTHFGPKVGL